MQCINQEVAKKLIASFRCNKLASTERLSKILDFALHERKPIGEKMKLKQISECRPDGKVSSFGYLVESASPDSLSNNETTICNLGSLQAGGLQKLVELSNSINEYLLESALKANRDSIASSRSYGIVYLV